MQFRLFQVRSDFMHLFESQLTVDGYTALIWAWWSDALQMRWPPIIIAGVRMILIPQMTSEITKFPSFGI